MKKLLACLVLAAFECFAVPAAACDTEATASPDSDCVVLSRAGARGVWFQLKVADDLRLTKLMVPELQKQILDYGAALHLRDVQIQELKDASTARQDISAQLQRVNEALERDAARARKEAEDAKAALDAWYRSPLFLIATGAVLGGAATAGLISAF